MSNPFDGKHVLLGITGSIACYKAADLASRLTQAGAKVTSILTPSALQFISPLTLQSVTGQSAYTDDDLWGSQGHVQHIGLGQSGDLFIIAPATANTIARLAHGLADNLLTLTALAAQCQIMIAPAMDGGMYANLATQANLKMLHERGYIQIGPTEGRMASGLTGSGRMVEPQEIAGFARMLLAKQGPLMGCKVVVTAGGTVEPIDPVRAITNHSSGKQGIAIAQEAINLGAQVTLIKGSTRVESPIGTRDVQVSTAIEMRDAVLEAIPQADILVMAAAVSDYQVDHISTKKYKKESGVPRIKLTLTPDILSQVAEYKNLHDRPRITIGFAAESEDLLKNAQKKLKTKNLDIIVANNITAPEAGFAVDTNQVVLIDRDGEIQELPLMSKSDVAHEVMQKAIHFLHAKTS
jgi:phosphopantothenoylcysteine decarboxylase/phosphopantothenate--cysteine ligase